VRRLAHKDTRNNDGDAAFVKFSLSEGNASSAKEGQLLLESIGKREGALHLMDRAYEYNRTRKVAGKLGFALTVPPKRSRRKTWAYDLELYKERSGIERFFRRLKAFRRVCTRYDKRDAMFSSFVYLAIISIALHRVNTT
jgi:transposase